MSRDLNDDFGDDDDAPGGPIDLEKGSHAGTGVSSSYDDGGIDFDDELYGDDGHKGGPLELDMPGGGRSHGPPPSPGAPPPAHGSGPELPDLAPSSRRIPAAPAPPSGPAGRPSGTMAAAGRPTSERSLPPANVSAPPPSSSGRGVAHSFGPGSSGQLPAAPGSDPRVAEAAASATSPPVYVPPEKPSSASVIAKYPDPPQKIWQAPMYAVKVVMRQFELRSDLESLRRRRSPDVPLYEAALRAYDARTFKLGLAINCAAFTILTFLFFTPVFIRFLRAD